MSSAKNKKKLKASPSVPEKTNNNETADSYARHKERVETQALTKDVSGVKLGNISMHIKKKKLEHDDDFAALEKKREQAQALIKNAELRENLRVGPWILIINLECAKGLRNAEIKND